PVSGCETRAQHLSWWATCERRTTRPHLVKHHPETPDIGALTNGGTACLLRRHVTDRSKDRTQVGFNQLHCFFLGNRCWYFLFGQLCNPKVEHFYIPVRPQHD